MKQLKWIVTSLVLIASLAGCKDQVPKCSDDDTIALVKNIVAEQLGDGKEVAKITEQFDVQLPRASGFNESIKKYECEARLASGGTYQLPITYSSQIDDGGQHIVFVDGIGRGDLFQLALAASAKIKQADESAAKAREAATTAEIKQAADNAAKARAVAAAAPPPLPAPLTSARAASATTLPAIPSPGTNAVVAPQALAAPSQGQQTPSSTNDAADHAVANDVPAAVKTFMEKSYGQFYAKHACWRTTYEDRTYCMKVTRMDRVAADTGERFYLLVGGQPLDEGGEPETAHVLSGLVGAFVFEIHPGETELVASNKSMYIGASGVVPENWELVKLATTGYYGWRTTWGDCHMGQCGSRLTILAPFGKSVKDVAAFNVGYSDGGACDTQECPNGKSSVESTVTIDASATGSEIHPLLVAFKGKMEGRNLAGTARRLDFDRKAWRYAVPSDWPLADVEF